MSNILSTDKNLCFAALKLIEQLYAENLISEHTINSILNEYSSVVDTSRFLKELRER